MTIKPFCIRTENLSGMEIASAIELCVKCGCIGDEGVEKFSKYTCFNQLYDHNNFEFFGVDSRGHTVLWDRIFDFGNGAIEITIDQLPAHLGIDQTETPEDKEAFEAMIISECGDEVLLPLPPIGVNCEWKGHRGGFWVPCTVIGNNGSKIVVQNTGEYRNVEFEILDLTHHEFRKPETPRQREKREAVENLRDAIQRCEDVGASVYYGNELIIGAVIEGKSTSLVKG